MIYDLEGDMLLTKAQAFAHGVSPNDHFDAGLALALREMWPGLAKDFRHYAHQSHPKPGELWTYRSADGHTIYNLMTQEGDHASSASGRASTPDVYHVSKRIRHELDKGDIKSVALSRLATGAGGLDCDEVRALIQQHLGDVGIPVHVYVTYPKGVAGKEVTA